MGVFIFQEVQPLKVLKVEPNTEPYEIEIPEGLEPLQKQVEGYIEVMYPYDDLVGIVCNEEGKIRGMELNRSIYDEDGQRIDVIAGPFLVVGLGEDNFVSLPDDLMHKYKQQFYHAELFMQDAGTREIISIKFEPTPKAGATHEQARPEPDRSDR